MTTLGIAETQARFDEITAPWLNELRMTIEAIDKGYVRIRTPYDKRIVHARGIVSGQSLLAVADASMVVAVWTWYDRFVPVATISLNMNFMRPAHGAVITETRLQRVGRRVIFGDAALRDAGSNDLLAQAAMTYTVVEEKAP
jgi:uncharacterized protein (TIGR00369 family)